MEDNGNNSIDEIKGPSFLKNDDTIEEGDTVIVYVNQNSQYAVVVKRGVTLHMKYGALRHEFLIGKRYGVPISATAGYVYVLRATAHYWTKTLPKRTQILYTPDIGMILPLLEAKPGSVVCETGTGSGSLTHALAVCVSPNGHVYSHDIDESRVQSVQNDIKLHGLAHCTTVVARDACKEGFAAEDCDCVFLDLPSPWLAIEHCVRALSKRRGGRLVSFSPCIEQVQQVVTELERHGFVEVETVEIVPQKLKVIEVQCETLAETAARGSNVPAKFRGAERKRKAPENGDGEDGDETAEPVDEKKEKTATKNTFLDTVPFPFTQPTHTGYLTSATLLPRVE